MSRSAEETQALEERIRRMKLNSERLKQRHLEVEEDKLYAAKQNALVQVVPPPGNDWMIRNRNTDFEYVDNRSPPQTNPFEGFGESRGRGRGRGRGQPRRSWSNEHDDRADDPPRPRRSGPGFEQQRPGREPGREGREPGREGRELGREGREPGRDRWAKPSPNAPGLGNAANMVIGNWEDPATESRRAPRRSNQNAIPSKVFSNTSLEGGPPPHKAKYRLAEGDGPPPDPSYSFLGDSMRDGNRTRTPERRKDSNRGMHYRSERGPGSGRTIVNRENKRSPMSQQSYDEWRRERDAIDERRINRQKTSDGHWSREWDNDKIVQNDASPPRHSGADNWGNSRRRYNNRFGDFLDESFHKRPRTGTRSNQSQLNTSGSSDSRSPEKESGFHDHRNHNWRQPRRQFSNENHSDKSSYDSPNPETRRSPGIALTKPLNPSARLEAARRATGPVVSSLRQYDTDVCTVTLPSSITLNQDKSPAATSPDKNNQASSPTLKVVVRTDETGKRTRIVEGVGCPELTSPLGIRDPNKKNPELAGAKKKRQVMVKTRKKRASQSPLSKDDDESWEDVSSEDDVSFVADLPKMPLESQLSTKAQDVSSGPESLDPIPAASKEEELLWEEFHPAGFQNNMTLAMVTETAYKALLSKGDSADEMTPQDSGVSEGAPNFSLDPTDRSEESAAKLDPILVVTQIVKAEVDCMSLTSVTTDSSLPEDINSVLCKSEAGEERKPVIAEVEADAEEISGPVSILDIPPSKEEAKQSDSPKSEVDGEPKNVSGVDTKNVDSSEVTEERVDLESTSDTESPKQINVEKEVKESNDRHSEDLAGCKKDDELPNGVRKEDIDNKQEVKKSEDIEESVQQNNKISNNVDENEGKADSNLEVENSGGDQLKESANKDVEDQKQGESNIVDLDSDSERREIVNLRICSSEKSETVNGECVREDSGAVDDRSVGENVASVLDESVNSDKSDDKDTSTVASGDEHEGATKSIDNSMNDCRETKYEKTESNDASQSSEMSR